MANTRMAEIVNGVVANIIVTPDNKWNEPGKTFAEVTPDVGIGWTYDGQNFVEPIRPAPTAEELARKAKQELVARSPVSATTTEIEIIYLIGELIRALVARGAFTGAQANAVVAKTPHVGGIDQNIQNLVALISTINKLTEEERRTFDVSDPSHWS